MIPPPSNPQAWFDEIEEGFGESLEVIDQIPHGKRSGEVMANVIMLAGVQLAGIARGIKPSDPDRFDAKVLNRANACILANKPRYHDNPPLIFSICYLCAHVEHRLLKPAQIDELIPYLVCRFRAIAPR